MESKTRRGSEQVGGKNSLGKKSRARQSFSHFLARKHSNKKLVAGKKDDQVGEGRNVLEVENDYLPLLEYALELSGKVGTLTTTTHIFKILLGKNRVQHVEGSDEPAETDPNNIIEQLKQNAMKRQPLPLKNLLEECILSKDLWTSVMKGSLLRQNSNNLIAELQEIVANMNGWFDLTIRNPQVEVASVFANCHSEVYLTGNAIRESYLRMYGEFFKGIRQYVTVIQSFSQERDSFSQVSNLDTQVILRAVNDKAYASIEKSIITSQSMEDIDPGIDFDEKSETTDETEGLYTDQYVYNGLERSIHRSLQANNSVVENDPLLKSFVQTKMQTTGGSSKRMSVDVLFGKSKDRITTYVKNRTSTMIKAESLVDNYLACACILVITVAHTETLSQTTIGNNFSSVGSSALGEILTKASALGSHIVRTGLPLLERFFDFEPNFVKHHIFHLSVRDLYPQNNTNKVARRIVHKFRLLHNILTGFDVHIFPRTIRAHQGALRSISTSHLEADIVLTGGDDNILRIWDLRTGECLAVFSGHQSIVTWCRFTSDDKYIVSCSFDTTIRVWNSKDGSCLKVLTGHSESIIDGDLSPNDKMIISASMDGTVRLWSLENGNCYRVYRGHVENTWVKCVKFTPDGTRFISGGLDGNIVLWGLEPQATPPPKYDEKKYESGRHSMRRGAFFSPANEAGGENSSKRAKDSSMKMNSMKNGNSLIQQQQKAEKPIQPRFFWNDIHTDYILDLAVLDASKSCTSSSLLLVASKDVTNSIVDLGTCAVLQKIAPSKGTTQSKTWANTVAFSPKGDIFAIGSYDNSLCIYTTETGKMIRNIRVQCHGLSRLAFSGDGNFLFIGTSTGHIQLIPIV